MLILNIKKYLNLTQLYTNINKDLNILEDCFRANKLNINKTTYMVFQNKREQPNNNITINIETKNIKRKTPVQFLGFIIEHQPHWTKHLKLCKSKMAIQGFIHNLHSVNNCFGRGDIYTM